MAELLDAAEVHLAGLNATVGIGWSRYACAVARRVLQLRLVLSGVMFRFLP